MTNQIRRLALALVLASFGVVRLSAANVVVGIGETKTVEATGETVQADNLTVVPGGTLIKTGAGNLTLATDKLRQGTAPRIAVAEGSLTVTGATKPADNPFAVAETVIRTKASLWLDVSDEDSLVRDDGGNITDWLDVRETGTAGAYTRNRAHTDHSVTNLYPVLTEKDGVKALFFQGAKSGCWMNFLTPADAQATESTRNTFAISAYYTFYNNLLGSRKDLSTIARGFSFANRWGEGIPALARASEDYIGLHFGHAYLDGQEFDPFSSSKTLRIRPSTFQLFESQFIGFAGDVQCLYNNRDYWYSRTIPGWQSNYNWGDMHCGGDYVSEIVLFATELPEDERIAVGEYLMHKWLGSRRPKRIDIVSAEGAEVKLASAAAGAENIAKNITGDGMIAKSDASVANLGWFADAWGFRGKYLADVAGVTLFSDVEPVVSAGQDLSVGEAYDGRTMAVKSAAKAGELHKTGNGPVRLSALPDGTAKLVVEAGELALEAPRAKLGSVTAGGDVYATIPNPSFESFATDTAATKNLPKDGTLTDGWMSFRSKDYNATIYDVTRKDGGYVGGRYWGLSDKVPDGECAIVIDGDCELGTTITVPKAGYYRLTLGATSRNYSNYGNGQFDVYIGASRETAVKFGKIFLPYYYTWCKSNGWITFAFTTPYLKPGDYQLWFKPSAEWSSLTENKARCAVLDNLVMKRVREREGLDVIPNGSFEILKGTYDIADGSTVPEPYSGYLSLANSWAKYLADWTITCPSDFPTTGNVPTWKDRGWLNATPVMTKNAISYHGWQSKYDLCTPELGDDGQTQLYLCDRATASVTFTPPAGTFRVQASAGIKLIGDWVRDMKLAASVTVGGVETDLGFCDLTDDFVMKKRVLPKAVTFDGQTEVTLTLKSEMFDVETADKVGQILVDNVRLLPVGGEGDPELLPGGDVETLTGWTCVASVNNEGSKVSLVDTTVDQKDGYGCNWLPEGMRALRIMDDSSIARDIALPAGLYRLSFYSRRRWGKWDVCKRPPSPLDITLTQGGKTVSVLRQFVPASTNFCAYSAVFKVPCDGTWNFKIQGTGGLPTYANSDMDTFLDNISIRPETALAATPDLPTETEVTVANGAKLRLSFTGTNEVGRIRLGGSKVWGVVSEATHPEFVCGPGAIEAPLSKRPGALLIVR